jgi:hypothetical protein
MLSAMLQDEALV